MRPSSFCTICTHTCYQELLGLLLTLSIHHPNETIYCMVDTKTKEEVEKLSYIMRVNVVFITELDKYSGKDRREMEEEGVWAEFQNTKGLIMKRALEDHPDTLFLDSDIVIINPIECIDNTKKLGLSPHYIRKRDTDKYGYYNGGVAWTSCKEMPEKWRQYTLTSRYYDQASLEDVARDYKNDMFVFGKECNFSWWRVFQSNESPNDVLKHLTIKRNVNVFYDDKPLCFVHTHFNLETGAYSQFNNLVLKALLYAKKYGELTAIGRMCDNKWQIMIPKQPQPGKWLHNNDSFRELAVMISEKYNDVVIEDSPDPHVRLGSAIVLYDRPTKNWFTNALPISSLIFIGNGSMNDEHSTLRNMGGKTKPWIFWPRNPRHYNDFIEKNRRLSFNERELETVFIGNIENNIQGRYRANHNWGDVLTEYHCTKGTKHKFSSTDYLRKLGNSKFGLCLRGFGSKCHREVELMGLGTVPIITPDVSIKDYLDPPIENVHYIYVSSPDELNEKISQINGEKWEEMSLACYDWYMRNVSVEGSWMTTLRAALYD